MRAASITVSFICLVLVAALITADTMAASHGGALSQAVRVEFLASIILTAWGAGWAWNQHRNANLEQDLTALGEEIRELRCMVQANGRNETMHDYVNSRRRHPITHLHIQE